MKKQKKYNSKKIEKKWQKYWEEKGLFKTPADTDEKSKFYILPQLPYPSGSGLHVGHAEVYTACDIFARYQRMKGKKVLQVIGWDAFGLPAENYAIKTNIHPRKSTDKAINNFRKQIRALGVSVDWEREVGSHNSDYYKWTQWFFLLMYQRGLAYRKMQSVNWCESCKTVLANEQVAGGECERCGTKVVQKEMTQWYLKITDYADRLYFDLDKVDWPEESIKRQRDWIGRSEGAEVKFKVKCQISKTPYSDSQKSPLTPCLPAGRPFTKGELIEEEIIEVYTTRPDTLFGATFLVVAPEVMNSKIKNQNSKFQIKIQNLKEVEKYIDSVKLKTELDRQQQKEKTGMKLEGVAAINPVNNKEIPIFVADYVLPQYGTGAIMAVPAHDERDWEFAKKYDLEIVEVIISEQNQNAKACPEHGRRIKSQNDNAKLKSDNLECFSGDGKNINSDFLNGLKTEEAKKKIIAWLEEKGLGQKKVQYKLRDWSVSRQRFWGAPIPILYDDKGEVRPVPEEDLPVILPDDVDFKPTGESPLNYSKSFQKGVEKKYGKGWKREPDTLDTFMCSSWYYYRYLDPKNENAFASPESLKKWMPVDFYLGGPEHVNGHLLYSRFFTKVLFDAGYVDFDEPFKKHRHQGLILGEDNRKMSKRWGNVINPSDVADEYGADTLRMYEMFMGPLEDDKPWDTNGVKGIRRFLEKIWRLFGKVNLDDKIQSSKFKIQNLLNYSIKKVTEDIESLRFNTAIAQLMILTNEMEKEEEISAADFEIVLKLLSPFAPHLTEELWEMLGYKESVVFEKWPEYDEKYLVLKTAEIAVQVNGKLRDNIEINIDDSEEQVRAAVLVSERVKKYLEGKEPKKVIYIKGRLVNIVV